VDFRQPHRIEPPALGSIDLVERGGERLLVGHSGGALKLVKHAELERHSYFSFSPYAARPPLIMADPRRIFELH